MIFEYYRNCKLEPGHGMEPDAEQIFQLQRNENEAPNDRVYPMVVHSSNTAFRETIFRSNAHPFLPTGMAVMNLIPGLPLALFIGATLRRCFFLVRSPKA
jgi:hypothetical protein